MEVGLNRERGGGGYLRWLNTVFQSLEYLCYISLPRPNQLMMSNLRTSIWRFNFCTLLKCKLCYHGNQTRYKTTNLIDFFFDLTKFSH